VDDCVVSPTGGATTETDERRTREWTTSNTSIESEIRAILRHTESPATIPSPSLRHDGSSCKTKQGTNKEKNRKGFERKDLKVWLKK
jgi:hypothetical protein